MKDITTGIVSPLTKQGAMQTEVMMVLRRRYYLQLETGRSTAGGSRGGEAAVMVMVMEMEVVDEL